MTFPAELERLLKEATEGPWRVYDDSNDGKTNRMEIVAIGKTVAHIYQSVTDYDLPNAELIVLLRNHADAILGLVRAAENLRDGLPEQDPYASELVAALAEELAKLNGGKG